MHADRRLLISIVYGDVTYLQREFELATHRQQRGKPAEFSPSAYLEMTEHDVPYIDFGCSPRDHTANALPLRSRSRICVRVGGVGINRERVLDDLDRACEVGIKFVLYDESIQFDPEATARWNDQLRAGQSPPAAGTMTIPLQGLYIDGRLGRAGRCCRGNERQG